MLSILASLIITTFCRVPQTFGGLDYTLFIGDAYYTPIIKEWYYQIALTGIAVDDQPISVCCDGVCCSQSIEYTVVPM